MVFAGRAEIVEGGRNGLRTVTASYPVPSVIRIHHRVQLKKVRVRLSRKAVLSRDRYACQYCGSAGADMTVDHLIPKHRGGEFSWENLVCACHACNAKKGDRSPTEAGMNLLRSPKRPSFIPYISYAIVDRGLGDEEWLKYLPQKLYG